MKKLSVIAFTAFFLFAICLSQNAEAQNFQEGDFALNAGIGVGSVYGWAGGLGMPLGANLEYAITSLDAGVIGIGGDFGFVSGSGLTITTFGARGSFYFTEIFGLDNPDLDIYGGIGIYYRNWSWSGTSLSGFGGTTAAFHAGARYYFTDNVGGFVELGNNWGWLNLGVAFKF